MISLHKISLNSMFCSLSKCFNNNEKSFIVKTLMFLFEILFLFLLVIAKTFKYTNF